MADVVDLRKYRGQKTPKKPFPLPWNQPRTVQKVSQEALLLMSFATTGVLASYMHFVIIPALCTIACLVLVADLMYLAFRQGDDVADNSSRGRPPSGAA